MENENIINTVTAIFNGADARDWQKVKAAFADEVLLDYSSMNGNPAAQITSDQIIAAWSSFLPGFDKTHHNVFDFKVDQSDDMANVHFTGIADHFIGESKWTVEGTYDVEAIRKGDSWQVSKFRLNFEKQSGETSLPQKAAEIMSQKLKK
jgi:hypothetical protein